MYPDYHIIKFSKIPGQNSLNMQAKDIVDKNKYPGMLERDYKGGTSIDGDLGHSLNFDEIMLPGGETLKPWLNNLVMQPIIATVTAFYNKYFKLGNASPLSSQCQWIRVHRNGKVKALLVFNEFVDIDLCLSHSVDNSGNYNIYELGETKKAKPGPDPLLLPLLAFELEFILNPEDKTQHVGIITSTLMHSKVQFLLKGSWVTGEFLQEQGKAITVYDGPYGIIDAMLSRVLFEYEYVPGAFEPRYCLTLDPSHPDSAVVVDKEPQEKDVDGWLVLFPDFQTGEKNSQDTAAAGQVKCKLNKI